MKKSTRALAGLVVIDGLLLLGTTWMVIQTKTGAWASPDFGWRDHHHHLHHGRGD